MHQYFLLVLCVTYPQTAVNSHKISHINTTLSQCCLFFFYSISGLKLVTTFLFFKKYAIRKVIYKYMKKIKYAASHKTVNKSFEQSACAFVQNCTVQST